MLGIFAISISSLIEAISNLGYFGIFAGMILESSLIPLPSELILIPAGVLIAKGQMNFLAVFLAGIIGSLIGSAISYLIAFFLGRVAVDVLIEKYGKFFLIKKEHLKKTDDYFKSYGEVTVFIGRLIFGVRHVISLVAGFAEMNFPKFVLFTIFGAGLWNFILIMLGYFFQNNYSFILNDIKIILILASLTIFLYWMVRKNSRRTL